MGIMIEDGKGNGGHAEVKDNKLLVSGVFSTQEHFANHNQGRGYNVSFNVTPSASSCFFYIKNDDEDYALSIEGIWLRMETDEYIDVKLRDFGTPTNGIDVVPVNMNSASARQANGEFQYGTNIGGLSGGSTGLRIYHAGTYESIYRNFNMDIILGANGVFSLYCGNGSIPISGTVVFNYHGTHN